MEAIQWMVICQLNLPSANLFSSVRQINPAKKKAKANGWLQTDQDD